jgi:hypothetical protein
LLLLIAGFAFGLLAGKHLKRFEPDERRQAYLYRKGDAPPAVRERVLATLRAFQNGYSRRDPRDLDSFMHRLFVEDNEVLLLGTDAGEWVRGYHDVGRFIANDWEKWGDFKFAVDDALIWSSGEVAWVASVGTLHGERSDRPVRLSAILVPRGEEWVFRQLHFQWDERDPVPAELASSDTLARLVRMVLRFVTQGRHA